MTFIELYIKIKQIVQFHKEVIHIDHFFNLRAEKQEHIINAALHNFGKNGYRKASTADIASGAGIAKGMINYYFGSKKNLYLYLVDYCGRIVIRGMEQGGNTGVTDFFDNMKQTIRTKLELMKAHPAIFTFLTGVYYETALEVAPEVKHFIAQSAKTRESLLYREIDVSRFKPDVNPKLIDQFLVFTAEGFTNRIGPELNIEEIESFTNDLCTLLDLMKRHFYT